MPDGIGCEYLEFSFGGLRPVAIKLTVAFFEAPVATLNVRKLQIVLKTGPHGDPIGWHWFPVGPMRALVSSRSLNPVEMILVRFFSFTKHRFESRAFDVHYVLKVPCTLATPEHLNSSHNRHSMKNVIKEAVSLLDKLLLPREGQGGAQRKDVIIVWYFSAADGVLEPMPPGCLAYVLNWRISYVAIKIPPLPHGPLSVRKFHLLALRPGMRLLTE